MVLTFNLPNPIVTAAKAIQMKSTEVLYRVNEIQWFFFLKTQYKYGIRLFFSVYWVGVMFRLTGWNKINEILTSVCSCFSAADGFAAPSSGWNRHGSVTEQRRFIPRHILFWRTMTLQTWTAHRPEARYTKTSQPWQLQNHVGSMDAKSEVLAGLQ